MKKNGYLLSELIICFALSFVILIIIFNTTITLNKKLNLLFIENKAASSQIVLNSKVGADFSTKTVQQMTPTIDDLGYDTCEIRYTDNTVKYLSYSKTENFIIYDTEQINISNGLTINDNVV